VTPRDTSAPRHYITAPGELADLALPQPARLPARATGTEARVCTAIAARQALGLRKYGTSVQDNPLPLRAWLQHALEEALDLAIYLQRAIEQIDTPPQENQA
jgi:hypothetical protein